MSQPFKLAILLGLTVVGFFLSLGLGSVVLNGEELLQALRGYGEGSTHSIILYSFRLPRTLLALVAGASLSLCGLLMQTYFRNPLAGPGILGISAAASLGAALSLLVGPLIIKYPGVQAAGLFLFAFTCCLGYTVFLFILSYQLLSHIGLLLLGVMASYFINALISIFISLSEAEEIRRFIYWGFGSFEGVSGGKIAGLTILLAASLSLVFYHSKGLNALLLGEEPAQALGVNTQGLRYLSIGITCLVTALVTSICGPIGFVGLAGPHLARLVMQTADHRWLTLACLLSGASLALGADIIARLPGYPGVLPINAVLSLVGGAGCMLLILSRK